MLKIADYDMEEPDKEKSIPDTEPEPESPDPMDTTYGLELEPEEKPKLNWLQRIVKSIFRIS